MVRTVFALSLAALMSGCGSGVAPTGATLGGESRARGAALPLKAPILVAFDTTTGSLIYWTISRHGSSSPQSLSAPLGITEPYAMVAHRNTVAIANYAPPEVVLYNVKTKVLTTLSDPYGNPIDLAIDKTETIYALNSTSVTEYQKGSSPPSQLTCSALSSGVAIAVNNEGNVFINGYDLNGVPHVFEITAGSQSCTKPHLLAERGYAGGIAVDPKTDDLIVVDDSQFCAGPKGRMLIYPPPYREQTVQRRILRPEYCAGGVRLNAASTRLFFADSTVSDGFPLISQRNYPSVTGRAVYSSSDSFSGFTTIPNTLPN